MFYLLMSWYDWSIWVLSCSVGWILSDLTLIVICIGVGGDLSIFIHSMRGLGSLMDFITSSFFIWCLIVCFWVLSSLICESMSFCICGVVGVLVWKCLNSNVLISSDAFTPISCF